MDINWEIPATECLSYELVTVTNYLKILNIFIEDEHPFVSDSYKEPNKLKVYFENMEKLRQSKSKYAGQEWLLYHRADQKYIGIVSLYDLSNETLNDNDQRCTLGFAISAPYRRQGYGNEAVKSLIHFSKNNLGRHLLLAYTHDSNPASKRLLTKLGFQDVTDQYICGPDIRYFSLEV
ncbi:MAG: hypothetical protein RIR48_1725 [Bacteroidota bacterium]|jgi:RimJ/RimL family protein N-acetyltransferase